MPALTPLYVDTDEAAGQSKIPISARDLRAQADDLQPGVVRPNHLAVAAASGGLTVQPGVAYVPDGQAAPTLYRCEWTGAAATPTIPPADASSARLDQVIALVRDANYGDGGTARDWDVKVLPGLPAGGTTLDTRAGAAALPARAIRLADVLRPPGSGTTIVGTNVRDRRPRARGFAARNMITTQQLSNAAWPTAFTPSVVGTVTGEFGGLYDVRVRFRYRTVRLIEMPNQLNMALALDGNFTADVVQGANYSVQYAETQVFRGPFELEAVFRNVPAGRHVVQALIWADSGAAASIVEGPMSLTVEELTLPAVGA